MIDYQSISGKALKGGVILPPGFDTKRRFPLLVWNYPGPVIKGERSFWTNPYLPGIYNLHLYAARGYVVLAPSMPISKEKHAGGPYGQMVEGVLPAIDKLVELGIADEDRVGLFGQSFGGYGVYSLVTQTDRFSAAAAFAGFTDLAVAYGSFDGGATGWPGIAQDKSVNAEILVRQWRVHGEFFDDPAIHRANSPITYVGRVNTPLLMAHGSLDVRLGMVGAEMFFSNLYRQGKAARLLRYEGENHSLSLSPANVRHLFEETVAWFDKYLMDGE